MCECWDTEVSISGVVGEDVKILVWDDMDVEVWGDTEVWVWGDTEVCLVEKDVLLISDVVAVNVKVLI